ncbi:MAG TPA: DUF4397 domain-containing protein, partial [Polyangia bacterium]|nr:DUF4397 domain-containing protein [Polyangia bacterium]
MKKGSSSTNRSFWLSCLMAGALAPAVLACSSSAAVGPAGAAGKGDATGGASGAGDDRDAASDGAGTARDAGGTGLRDGAPGDAGVATDAGAPTDAVAPGPPAQVRLAHLAPDLAPFDFCLAPHGTADYGRPLLGGQANADGGVAASLAYPQVSAYLPVDAGRYDARLVAAGAASCASPLVPDATDLAPFTANAAVTLLVAGALAPSGGDAPLALAVLADDAALAGSAASLRAVNAVPSLPSADFGLGSFAGGWLPLFTKVGFGAAATTADPSAGVVDARGYLFLSALDPQAFSVRAAAGATADV